MRRRWRARLAEAGGAGVRAAHRLAQLRALTLHCGGSGAYNSIGGSDPAGTIDEHAPEEGFHRAWQVALRAAARAMVDAALPTHGGNSLGHYRHRAPGAEGLDARAFDRPPPDPQPAQEFLTTLASTKRRLPLPWQRQTTSVCLSRH